MEEENKISFVLSCGGTPKNIETAACRYNTLMQLISDRCNISGFAICGGMGSCGTCFVRLCRGALAPQVLCSCQTPVDAYLAGSVITVLQDE